MPRKYTHYIKPTKEEMEERYSNQGESISSLSRHYGVSNPVIRQWLIEYNIERRTHLEASRWANKARFNKEIPDTETLQKQADSESLKDIQKIYSIGQNTLYEWFNKKSIDLKPFKEKCSTAKKKQHQEIQFSKEFLEEKYDRSKPIEYLATELNVSGSHIKTLFKKHGIEIAKSYRSMNEMDLYDYCVNHFPEDEIVYCDKSIIAPYELDIVNKTKKIAIEYCGLYWHSETNGGKNKNYHREKFIRCAEAGYKLITIFSSDDQNKVKQLLNTLHGKNTRIFARNTSMKIIDVQTAKEFTEKYHLHNFIGAKHHYGLFYNDVLVMVASFGKSRFSNNYEYECTRMVSHGDYTIVGGASKLFKGFIRNVNPSSCITFADLRFGDGKTYEKCGYEFVEYTYPNYWYFKNDSEILSRVAFQKHKLKHKLAVFDESKTEYENMLLNGWDRIWDCGNGKYVYRR